MDNLSDIDDDDIESMELLDGNYQNYMQWIRPDRFWDTSPNVRVAFVRYAHLKTKYIRQPMSRIA